jgi:DNA-binding CsgD family transcriptional regulator
MNNQISIEIMEQLPGYIGWKDKNSHHLGCNKNLANILQLKNPNKIIGLLDTDFLGSTDEQSRFHRENDQLALTGKTVRCIHKSSLPYDGTFFYFIKKPIIDDKNYIKGIIYHCNEFINSDFIAQLYQQDIAFFSRDSTLCHYKIGCENNIFSLSDREIECLFFTLRGMTAKQIGEKICLSKRTIEAYIENIKNKFGCHSKSELLIRAVKMGYMDIIPPRFLHG